MKTLIEFIKFVLNGEHDYYLIFPEVPKGGR
jgi:hypothetical protein